MRQVFLAIELRKESFHPSRKASPGRGPPICCAASSGASSTPSPGVARTELMGGRAGRPREAALVALAAELRARPLR
jgi:hypothetical protein